MDGPAPEEQEGVGALLRRAGVLGLGAVAFLVYLNLRDAGLYPSVLSDEQHYSEWARHLPRSEAAVPSYVYLWVFSGTRSCGQGFLDCARGLNALALLLGVALVYSVCRTVASPRTSALVAAQTALSPFNTYGAYFMPESLYFLGFWLLAWFVLRVAPRQPWALGAGAGALIGLLAMVKMHGLFLFLGLGGFLLWGVLFRVRPLRLAELATLAAACLGAFAIVRLGGGYLLAGTRGLSLLGAMYGGTAGQVVKGTAGAGVAVQVAEQLGGHLLALVALFAVPVGLVLAPRRRSEPVPMPAALRSVEGFLLAFLVPLLVIVVVFSVGAVGKGPYETDTRLHMRYYNFLFPLFSILAAGLFSWQRRTPGAAVSGLQRVLWAVLVLPLAYALLTHLRPFTPFLTDAPELSGLMAFRPPIDFLGLLALVTLALAALRPRWGLTAQVLLLAPLMTVATARRANDVLRVHLQPDPYDRAGEFARQYLGSQTSALVVAGSDAAGLYRALFQVDDPRARQIEVAEGKLVEPAQLPEGSRWVLYVGAHPVGNAAVTPEGAAFSLVRIDPAPGGVPGVAPAPAQAPAPPRSESATPDGGGQR